MELLDSDGDGANVFVICWLLAGLFGCVGGSFTTNTQELSIKMVVVSGEMLFFVCL